MPARRRENPTPDRFELAAQRAQEQVDSWLRQSQEQAETASDRMVTVTVDARGKLVDLKLTREAMDLFPSDLATTILDCVDKARSRAGAKASKIASDAWGAESDLAQRMRKAYSPRTEGASDAPDPGSGRDPHSQGPRGPGVGPDGMIVFNRGGR